MFPDLFINTFHKRNIPQINIYIYSALWSVSLNILFILHNLMPCFIYWCYSCDFSTSFMYNPTEPSWFLTDIIGDEYIRIWIVRTCIISDSQSQVSLSPFLIYLFMMGILVGCTHTGLLSIFNRILWSCVRFRWKLTLSVQQK